MKNVRDIVRLYRTLAAEGLRALADDETLERAGRRADDALWRLGRKIQPPAEGLGLGAGWTDLGRYGEGDIDLARMVYDDIAKATGDAMAAHLDGLFERISVEEKPLVDRAIHLRDEVYGPVIAGLFNQMSASIQVPEPFFGPKPSPHEESAQIKDLRWNGYLPTERTKAEQAMRDALPKFETFDIPTMPGLPDFQSMVSDMAKALRDAELGALPHRLIAGLEPGQEWIDIPLENVARFTDTPDANWSRYNQAWGVPLHEHPESSDLVRIKVAELVRSPHAQQIIDALLPNATPDEG